MADASLGTAVLRTKLDASGLKTGLQQAEADTKKFAGTASEAIKGIGAGFASIAASQGLRAYIGFMRDAAAEAHQASASSALFQKALERNNQSASEGAAMVQRLADKFGVVNSVVEESATFMLRQGASLDDVERALTAAGASAAAAGFDISTAFNNVGVAVATGRSQLLETSGIVANLGPVEQAYAKSVGKTVEQLTQQERIQARVNAIYQETASEIEDVDVLLKGLPKSQADVNKELTTFRQTAGDLALKVLVPLNEGFAGALRLVNGLPTPIKNAAIAMAGLATAATTLAAGFIAIKAALPALSGLGLASFGPAGWVVLGLTVVAGLAAALAGSGSGGEPSLETAIGRVSVAANNTTALEGLDSTLTTLASNLTGNVRSAFQGARDDILEIVGAAEDARAKLAAISLGTDLMQQAQNSPILRSSIESAFTVGADAQPAQLLREALVTGDFKQAITVAEDLLRRYTDIGSEMDINVLARFLEQLRGADSALAKLLAGTNNNGNGNGNGNNDGNGGKGKTARTWDDVLTELAEEGSAAMRRAALEGTAQAYRDAAAKRVSLIDEAITAALSAEFYGKIDPEAVIKLMVRRAAAAAEAAIQREGLAFKPGSLRIAAMDRAEVNGPSAGMANSTMTPEQMQEIIERRTTQFQTKWADYLADELGREYNRFLSLLPSRVVKANEQAYLRTLNDSEQEMTRWLNTAGRLTLAIKAANDETARMGLFADALKKYGAGREGLTGTTAADRTGPSLTGRDGAAAIARDTVEAVAQAFHAGEASIDDVRTAVEALTTLTPMSVTAINELTGGLFELAIEADRAKASAAALAEFESNPGLYGMRDMPIVKDFGEKFVRESRSWLDEALGGAGKGRSPGFDRDSVSSFKRGVDDSANAFRDTVIKAGIGFADTLVRGIQTGDTGSIISGLFGAGGSIIGSLVGGPWGAVISGLLPILGGLFGGLVGGDRDTEARRREELDRARSVPAININFNVQQTNNYQGGPRDPSNEQAFARQANALFEALYRRHLGPRLDRLERNLGLTGAGA